MNRREIKQNAKEIIKGNKWYLIKPCLLVTVALSLFFLIVLLIAKLFKPSTLALEIVYSITTALISFIAIAFSFGYTFYVLSFVRGVKITLKEMLQYAFSNMLYTIVLSFMVGLFILLGTVLLIVPGVILSLGLYFYREVYCDSDEKSFIGIIKEAWSLMKGHKFELFILILSFLGWTLLAELTLGILYIFVMPYMVVSFALFYEQLRKTA